MFGTIHSEDPRVTQLPEAVETYFNNADILMLEMSLDLMTSARVAGLMLQDADGSLSKQVGKSLAQEATVAMQSLGVPPQVTEFLQPWAVVMTLSAPPQVSGQFLDKKLYSKAIAAGKQFQPLESPEEQISVFTSMTIKEQKSLLHNVLDEYQSYPGMYKQLTKAYLARDLDKLVEISFANPMSDDPALQDKVMEQLLTRRNHRMVERMEAYFNQGKVFIAVGALHLVGEEGLISLLRQRGYTVSRIY
ncbi:TraB/GumN family protein [Candidatus Thiodiazotropha sp. CDECU1]|uniref:TraB/GumN family protein n=1 Tax=Candidatus Thiodiazotropha sp. CDECU1 TaxID=3065865 RepID=UPI00292FB872|nr:TraB/GumN family protein [Candidatus Thiodiazotropha sp. CDECU1]